MIVLNRILVTLLALASGFLFAAHHPISEPSPYPQVDAIAGEYGVRVVWTAPAETRCGVGMAGCYTPTAGFVELVNSLSAVKAEEVVRHEVAHFLIGQTCGANSFAQRDEEATEAYSDLYLGGDPALNGYRYGVEDVERAKNYRKGVC